MFLQGFARDLELKKYGSVVGFDFLMALFFIYFTIGISGEGRLFGIVQFWVCIDC